MTQTLPSSPPASPCLPFSFPGASCVTTTVNDLGCSFTKPCPASETNRRKHNCDVCKALQSYTFCWMILLLLPKRSLQLSGLHRDGGLLYWHINVMLWLGKSRKAAIMVKLWRVMRIWAVIYLINTHSNVQKNHSVDWKYCDLQGKKKMLARSVMSLHMVHLKKKKIWPFLRWLPANISAVFPLCFCSHKVIYVQVLSSWFSSCTNDFDCLFIVLSEHFCLPCHISWTSVSVIYRQLLCPCRVSPLFLLSCLWLFVCIICKFLEAKNRRKRTISSPCWPRK